MTLDFNFMAIIYYLLISILLIAVYFDLKKQIIPNWLTIGSCLVFLILSFIFFGFSGLVNHIYGALICGGVWLVFWRLGIMGGGDQKLVMAIGAALGQNFAWPLILSIALFGGVQSLIYIGWQWHKRKNNKLEWKHIKLPYSLAILAGTVSVLVLNFFEVLK